MGKQNATGFTIIETMLVLSVTSLMAVAILVGSGAQVRGQEYRSSVTGLLSEVQQQYSTVQNPINDRTISQPACGAGAGTASRGTSANCLIVGRLITSDGITLTETPVQGSIASSNINTDINNTANSPNSANGWTLYLDTNNISKYVVTWGSTLKAAVGSAVASSSTFNLLVIMSPADGSLYTYATNGAPITNPSGLYGLLAASSNSQQTLTLCVNSGSATLIGTPLAVQVVANASGANGISLPAQSSVSGICV